VALVVLCSNSGDEIHKKGEDVESENKGDHPFKDGGSVIVMFIAHNTEA
jgi:hypothetical protein